MQHQANLLGSVVTGGIAGGVGDGNQASISIEVQGGPNRMLLVATGCRQYVIASVTLGGVALKEAHRVVNDAVAGSSKRNTQLWYMMDPPVGSGQLVTATATAAGDIGIAIGAATFTYVDQRNPFIDYGEGANGASQTSLVVPAINTEDKCYVFGVATLATESVSAYSETLLWSHRPGTSLLTHAQYAWNPGAGTLSLDWTIGSTSTGESAIAVAIRGYTEPVQRTAPASFHLSAPPWGSGQPMIAPRVDWSNTLTRGLIAAVTTLPNGAAYDAVQRRRQIVQPGSLAEPKNGYLTQRHNGTDLAGDYDGPVVTLPGGARQAPYTIFTIFTLDASSDVFNNTAECARIAALASASTNYENCTLALDNTAGSVLKLSVEHRDSTIGSPRLVQGTTNLWSTAAGVERSYGVVCPDNANSTLYLDGKFEASGSFTATNCDATLLRVGHGPGNSTTLTGCAGNTRLALAFNRALSAEEMASLHRDPYQIFKGPLLSALYPQAESALAMISAKRVGRPYLNRVNPLTRELKGLVAGGVDGSKLPWDFYWEQRTTGTFAGGEGVHAKRDGFWTEGGGYGIRSWFPAGQALYGWDNGCTTLGIVLPLSSTADMDLAESTSNSSQQNGNIRIADCLPQFRVNDQVSWTSADAAIPVGKPAVLILTNDRSAPLQEFWVNGVKQANTTANSAGGGLPTTRLECMIESSGADAIFIMAAHWRRKLPDSEIKSISANWRQLFTYQNTATLFFTATVEGVYRPSSDVTTTGWTRTPVGGSLASAINEVLRDDATYIASPPVTATPQPYRHTLNANPPAGDFSDKVVARASSGSVTMTVRYFNAGGSEVGSAQTTVNSPTLTEYPIVVTLSDVATERSVEFTV